LSTDFEPDGSSREQNLAPDRGDRFSGTAPKAAAAAQDRRFRLVKITAASVLAHGCLLLAFVRLDEAPHPSEPAREIPVEVMTESASPEKRPAAPAEATRARSREPRQIPETEANPKPANEAMSGPNPVAKPAAPQPSATDGPQALAKPTRKDMAHQQIGHEVRPAVRLPARTGTAMSFDLGPDSFRAVAVPLPAANGGEAMSYTLIVGGMLDRVKHYPEPRAKETPRGLRLSDLLSMNPEESRRIPCCGRAAKPISTPKAWPWFAVPLRSRRRRPARNIPLRSKLPLAWEVEFRDLPAPVRRTP
jgi:outer membrane biosynthesis protein TonB